jgi:hypothetical protein
MERLAVAPVAVPVEGRRIERLAGHPAHLAVDVDEGLVRCRRSRPPHRRQPVLLDVVVVLEQPARRPPQPGAVGGDGGQQLGGHRRLDEAAADLDPRRGVEVGPLRSRFGTHRARP